MKYRIVNQYPDGTASSVFFAYDENGNYVVESCGLTIEEVKNFLINRGKRQIVEEFVEIDGKKYRITNQRIDGSLSDNFFAYDASGNYVSRSCNKSIEDVKNFLLGKEKSVPVVEEYFEIAEEGGTAE